MSSGHGDERRSVYGGIVERIVVGSERRSVVVILGGALLAIGVVLLGDFLPNEGPLTRVLYLLARSFPILGVGIVIGAIWWTRKRGGSSVSAMVTGPTPETAVTATERSVGRETGWALSTVTVNWYGCWTTTTETDIRTSLVDGAIRVCRARRGLQADAAREAVRSGTWTDDPVAAAFLADDEPQPVYEGVRGAVDPGAAYWRRVRRTLDAIEAIETDSRETDTSAGAVGPKTESTSDSGVDR